MKKITPDQYCECVMSIYEEQPEYELGHDGSDGKCDCIGMGRGALKRAGVTDIKGMSGTNYAARFTVKNLRKITSSYELRKGDVVFKTRDKDDRSMPLPARYRKGNADYNTKWGETNFTHYGTVTQNNPLRITHMTSPTAKIDTSMGKWEYVGELPWVDYDAKPAEEQLLTEWVFVYAENGLPVKMRAKPSTKCGTYWEVPSGAAAILFEKGEEWSRIMWGGQTGYMMNKYIISGEMPAETLYTVTITGQKKATAEEIIRAYGGTMSAE